ncbi:MAG TPA: TolC family protein [Bryobacteraceae bacterium]|nr:TolC family protein [Bryobacteraceae bacterium]
MIRTFEGHAQNGSRPRRLRDECFFRRLAARDSALCAPEEHAQNGSRPRRPNREFPQCMAARDSALCTSLLRIFSLAVLGVLAGGDQQAAEVKRLTLTEAVRLAVSQNRDLKIARLKVAESQQEKAQARSSYFPEIKNHSTFLRTTSLENLQIPEGAFGLVPSIGPVPNHGVQITQGAQTFETSGTGLAQPLTQLIRIRQANRIAASETASSKDEVQKAENEVAVKVHELYFSILATRLQKRAADQETAYARAHLLESEEDIQKGNALKISAIDGQASLLQSEQDALTAELQLNDLNTELNDLLGLPLDTPLELAPVEPATLQIRARQEYVQSALAENPELLAAAEQVERAKAGVKSAKSAYIPDVSAIARQSYQNGVPFLVHNFGTFGLTLDYDVFDFGKRRAVVRENEEKLAEAQENLTRLKEAVNVRIARTYNKVERSAHMLQAAREEVRLREEGERLATNQSALGVVLVSARQQASAANYKAQAGLLQAQLAYLLAGAELEEITGHTPGL